MENAFDGWASYYSRELNDMLWDSEFSFKRIAESFGRMITEMLIQSAMADIMGELFGTEGKNGEGGKAGLISTGINAVIDAWTASAKGNVFSNGQHLTAYARGGIVDKPTVFPMARGVGLMGEAGPEAVMPLTRTSSGDLGVRAEGRQQQTNYFNVTVQAPDGNISKESQRQLQRRLTRSVAMANRRA
jgi:lambda family phage tail tape measure protein